MNAHTLDFPFGALSDATDRTDSDLWARTMAVARAIPSDADLDDDADVARALFAARFCWKDFGDCWDEAIELARELRR